MFQTTNQCDIYAINSPARRDSWGAEPIDSNNPPFSGAASAGRGPHLQDRTRAKQKVPRCRNLHSSATSSTSFTVFDPTCPQHGLNLGPALANKAPTWAQLGPNLDPFGPVWEQQVGDYRPNLKSWKHALSLVFPTFTFCGIDDASCWPLFHMLCLRSAQLGAKLSPKGPPSCTMLNMTWTSMCTTWLQVQPIWIKLWAQLQPNITPTWAQVGYNIAQLGPKPFLRTQCDTLKTSVLTAISNVFWLQWGFVLCRVPHIGPVLGPASAAVAPLQDPVAQVKPNLRPKLVGAKWPEFGASYAQVGPESACVRPNLRPRTPKFDHSQLWLGQVALCSSPCIPNYHAP